MLVGDYLYIFLEITFILEIILYCLETIYILVGDYLYIDWRLSLYLLEIICILVGYYPYIG